MTLLLGQLGGDVPFVTAGADGLLVGDNQLQRGIGQRLFRRLDQRTVDRRLRQPDLRLVLLAELAVRHPAHVSEVGCDQRKIIGIDCGHCGFEMLAARLGAADLSGVQLDPVGPFQRHPGLTEMGRGVRRQAYRSPR